MIQLIQLLAAYGLAFTACDAQIFSRPRDWITTRSVFMYELLGCYFCFGFWSSAFVYGITFRDFVGLEYLENVVLCSFAGASFCYLMNNILLCLEQASHRKQT